MNTEKTNQPTARLRLTLSRVEGILVRVLGVVVRRGFEPIEVNARMVSSPVDKDVMHLDLRVQGPTPAAGLAAHLANLLDVHTVELLTAAQSVRSYDRTITTGQSWPPG